MANVGYADINTADAATLLGVSKWSVQDWCKRGLMQYINVGNGNYRARYMFTEDEIERVGRLIDKYGRKDWSKHYQEDLINNKKSNAEVSITTTINPEDYIPDDTDEIVDYVKKIRSLKIQRDKLLAELDSIDEAIKTMRAKVIESI